VLSLQPGEAALLLSLARSHRSSRSNRLRHQIQTSLKPNQGEQFHPEPSPERVAISYHQVLGKEIDYVNGVVRAKKAPRLPVVLTRGNSSPIKVS
jgi:hypothetical protein